MLTSCLPKVQYALQQSLLAPMCSDLKMTRLVLSIIAAVYDECERPAVLYYECHAVRCARAVRFPSNLVVYFAYRSCHAH